MNCSARRTRWSTVAAAGAVPAALAVSVAAPASAAIPAPAAAASVTSTPLPALDPVQLGAAIGGLPSADVTGALLRITGSAGHWSSSRSQAIASLVRSAAGLSGTALPRPAGHGPPARGRRYGP